MIKSPVGRTADAYALEKSFTAFRVSVQECVCVCTCICDDVIGDGDYSHVFNLNIIFSKISQNENC